MEIQLDSSRLDDFVRIAFWRVLLEHGRLRLGCSTAMMLFSLFLFSSVRFDTIPILVLTIYPFTLLHLDYLSCKYSRELWRPSLSTSFSFSLSFSGSKRWKIENR
ncbi:hypothetical protein BJX64DRAFT_271293 [Aspergillus heterothallicus]